LRKKKALLKPGDKKYLTPRKIKKNNYPAPITITSDTFQLYLADIKKEPMFTKEQEQEIGQIIKHGTPTDKQKAVNQLVKANLRFVVSLALHYDRERKMITDLINEGNIGLIKAANKFDSDRGFKFISYAVWWIRQHILHYIITHQHLITIPFNRAGRLRRVLKAGREAGFDIEKGSASISMIAEELNVKVRDIEEAFEFAQKDISLDLVQANGGNETILGFYPSPEEYYLKKAEMQEITRLMKNLTDREQLILKMYFGLGDYLPASFDKIGKKLGVSRERIRQIKERALQKMRQSPDSIKLRELIEG